MNKQTLLDFAVDYAETSELNIISAGEAISPDLAGIRLFDRPLMGVADARDPLFERFKDPEVIGPGHLMPEDILPGAESVVSFFFPLSRPIQESNAGGRETSALWLHGRIEGQRFIAQFIADAAEFLRSEGCAASAPLHSGLFRVNDVQAGEPFGSNWSDRHIAYAAGLGTFGLSRGLITEAGMAGRLASLVTAAKLPPDKRPYTGIYDYCIRCGACVRACPAGAISLERGKEHLPCAAWVQSTKERYAPRYGCGKCQCGLPCSDKIPGRK